MKKKPGAARTAWANLTRRGNVDTGFICDNKSIMETRAQVVTPHRKVVRVTITVATQNTQRGG